LRLAPADRYGIWPERADSFSPAKSRIYERTQKPKVFWFFSSEKNTTFDFVPVDSGMVG
jgi:hypothetical protein